jgi:integrase/recombinase XerD
MSSALPVWGRVQRVVENGCVSWTVIGDDRRPVAPVEAFLRWLTDTERSPNTVRAYAGDLRQFWEFVGLRGYDWADLGVEELGDFASGYGARPTMSSSCRVVRRRGGRRR